MEAEKYMYVLYEFQLSLILFEQIIVTHVEISVQVLWIAIYI